MRFACNLHLSDVAAVAWAARREQEGWDRLMIADHLVDPEGPAPHVWSLLGALATSTRRVRLGTGHHCNLFRHPVELAQACLSVQRLSGGRFEAGLGAGWAEEELRRTGRTFPGPADRASMLIEATHIVRQIFTTGAAHYEGQHYQVDVDGFDRLDGIGPPTLVVASGGPRVIRAVAPLVDKLELLPAARANRGGSWDRDAYAAVTADDVRRMMEIAREARPDVALQLHVACKVRPPRGRAVDRPQSFLGQFYGPAQQVADALLSLEELGIDEVYIGPHDEDTYVELAARLFAGPR